MPSARIAGDIAVWPHHAPNRSCPATGPRVLLSFPGIAVLQPAALRATCFAIVVCVAHAVPRKQPVVTDSFAPISGD